MNFFHKSKNAEIFLNILLKLTQSLNKCYNYWTYIFSLQNLIYNINIIKAHKYLLTDYYVLTVNKTKKKHTVQNYYNYFLQWLLL